MNRDENNHEEEGYEDAFKTMQCPYMKNPYMKNSYQNNPYMMNPWMMNPWMYGGSPSMMQGGSFGMQGESPSMKYWGHGHGSRSIDSDLEDEEVFESEPNDFRYPRRRRPYPHMRPYYYHHHHRPYYPRPYYRPMWSEGAFEEFDEE